MTDSKNHNFTTRPKLTTKDYVGSIRYMVDAIENGPNRTTQIGTNTWYDAVTNYPLNAKVVYNGGNVAHPEARVYGRLFDTEDGGRDAAINLFASENWTVEVSYVNDCYFGDVTGYIANCYIAVNDRYLVIGKNNGFSQLTNSDKVLLQNNCTLTLMKNGLEGYIYINGVQKCHLTDCVNSQQEYCGYLWELTDYCCVRVHDRLLASDEIMYNYEVDKERFGI